MKETLLTIYEKDATKKVLASLISILVGLFVGTIVVVVVGLTKDTITGKGIWDGVRLIFAGILSTGRDAAGNLTWGYNAQSLGNMLFRATPLIMTGLSVAVAYKTGLFNIGAPGQYLMGTLASLMIALGIPSTVVPAWIIWILAFLGGCLAGALWGAIPGTLKAFLNINEVLASIMTNWLAANLVTWAFDISNFKNVAENTKAGYIYKTSFNGVVTPKLGLDKLFPGSQVNMGILLAILIAIAMYLFLKKTRYGMYLTAVGESPSTSDAAGINITKYKYLATIIGGGISAIGGMVYIVTTAGCVWNHEGLSGVGWLAVALVIFCVWRPLNAIWGSVIFGAMMIMYLRVAIPFIPTQLYKILPYVVTVIVLIITSMRNSRDKQPPASLGLNYFREER